MFLPPCEACPLALAARPCISGEYRVLRDGAWYQAPKPRPAPVMVLGAAGGWQEEQQGRPFVGPSGNELMAALTKAGITEAYFANVTSCIPAEHGEPEHSAVKACHSRLEEQINAVRPKFILAFGNVAVQRLLGKGTVSALSGKEQWSGKLGCWVLANWHPAAILRSPSRRNGWLLDLIRYGHLIRGDIPLPGKPPIRVSIIETSRDLQRLYDRLRGGEPWTFDFETSLNPWWHRDFVARSVGFACGGSEATVLLLEHPDAPLPPQLARAVLQRLPVGDPSTRRIGHNVSMFDALVWYRITGQIPYYSDDTMVMAHLLDENEPKSLKWQGRAKLGWPDWDIDVAQKSLSKPKTKKGQEAPPPPRLSVEDFAFYNGADCCATYLLWEKFSAALRADERLWNYYRLLEMPKLRALTQMVARGIYVDDARLLGQWGKAAANWNEAKKSIPVENPASPEQVAKWLFEDLELQPIKYGKSRGSTDEESINRLAQTHPEVRAILPVRKWLRYQTTYFKPIHEMVRDSIDRRYHPEIRVTGTATGRLASPFHTIPRPTPEDGAFVRSIFTAPEGYTLLEADLSQVEARFCAWAAAGKPKSWVEVDPERARMLIAFHENRNIYAEQAAQNIYGDWRRWQQITYHERQIMGKVPVLAMLYRISPQGLKDYAWKEYQVDWSMKQSTKVWLGFHKLWPEFRKWHEREERALRLMGIAISPLGRRRRLPAAQQYGKVASEAIQQGINSPVQSTASDWTQAALIILEALAPRIPLRVVGDVHDALQVEVPVGGEGAAGKLVKWVMESTTAKYLERLGLYLPEGLIKTEIKMGPWGSSTVIA